MSARKILSLCILFVLLFLVLSLFLFSPPGRVCFDDVCLRVELAATSQAQAKGLMFRTSLPADRGMLFVFAKEDFWSFWMKNTYIPLDIIWMDSRGRVVDMVENAMPSKAAEPPSFKPVFAARYVLEANAGFAAKNGIKPGARARFRWIFYSGKL